MAKKVYYPDCVTSGLNDVVESDGNADIAIVYGEDCFCNGFKYGTLFGFITIAAPLAGAGIVRLVEWVAEKRAIRKESKIKVNEEAK